MTSNWDTAADAVPFARRFMLGSHSCRVKRGAGEPWSVGRPIHMNTRARELVSLALCVGAVGAVAVRALSPLLEWAL
jgi:hypothetical protein